MASAYRSAGIDIRRTTPPSRACAAPRPRDRTAPAIPLLPLRYDPASEPPPPLAPAAPAARRHAAVAPAASSPRSLMPPLPRADVLPPRLARSRRRLCRAPTRRPLASLARGAPATAPLRSRCCGLGAPTRVAAASARRPTRAAGAPPRGSRPILPAPAPGLSGPAMRPRSCHLPGARRHRLCPHINHQPRGHRQEVAQGRAVLLHPYSTGAAMVA
ncbi:hypothetical protein U9M48_003880 [Paspalum notatum var. saurae]|uniref:Uncharacterized protein n=1 Tax=Paspalum notatum var. saurae TaxID=547442 RepID=A0AAQ3PJL9_PASNO